MVLAIESEGEISRGNDGYTGHIDVFSNYLILSRIGKVGEELCCRLDAGRLGGTREGDAGGAGRALDLNEVILIVLSSYFGRSCAADNLAGGYFTGHIGCDGNLRGEDDSKL